jgi:hypothetical protein
MTIFFTNVSLITTEAPHKIRSVHPAHGINIHKFYLLETAGIELQQSDERQ